MDTTDTKQTMQGISLLLQLLANRVHIATVDGQAIRDASDFCRWLDWLAVMASTCTDPRDFFTRI